MTIIRKLTSVFGYMWAVLCLVVVLATFVGWGFWEKTLAQGTGLHISPRFSGGEVRQAIDHGSYRTLLHRLVFDGLVSERADGFVQIDWVPQGKQSLPSMLEEDFDINGDNTIEFRVRLDTASGKVELLKQTSWVLGLEPVISADSERILRVRLRNPDK